jgi:hypothetical protein
MKSLSILSTLILLLGLSACASKPRPYVSYSAPSHIKQTQYNQYSTPSYSPPRPSSQTNQFSQSNQTKQNNTARPVQRTAAQTSNTQQSAAPAFVRLSYEDLVRFQVNCEQRTEQIALLEEQLKRNRFYTVDGVEGNAAPDKISKSYYSLAKYRIWSVRFACQGSPVDAGLIQADLRAVPNKPPEATPRCYFEEVTVAKAAISPVNLVQNDQTTTRKEICTNFPYVADRPFIRVGDQISFTSKDLQDSQTRSSLRRWRGNVYQLISKTELIRNQAVRFTLVAVRSGSNQWVVVDKF